MENSVDPVGIKVKNEPVCGSRAWMRANWSLSFASRSKLLRVCCALLRVELFAGNSKRSKYHSQPCAQALSKSIPDHFGTDFGVLVVYLNLGQVFQSWLGEISGRFCYLLAGQRQDARPFCLCTCRVPRTDLYSIIRVVLLSLLSRWDTRVKGPANLNIVNCPCLCFSRCSGSMACPASDTVFWK